MMNTSRSPRILALLRATTMLSLSAFASAQSSPQAAHDKPLRFEVVSIRPSGEPSKSGGMQILPDGFQAIGMAIESTVYVAYVPAPFFKHLEEVKGFPSWATSEKYDLRAKVAPEDVDRWRSLSLNITKPSAELQSMLRALIAERCNLQIHGKETMIDAFALVRRPNAPPLTESTELPTSGTIMELTDGAKAVFEKREGERIYTFYNTPMSVLASFIGIPSKRPMEDHTGLKGRYTLVLHAIDAAPFDAEEPQERPAVPYDIRAIGMTVKNIKVKSTLYTIDHIDRPTPN